MTEPDELQRLRRQLRAMASLNEQLRAQLEALATDGGPTRGPDPLQKPPGAPVPLGAAPRRGRRAQEWVQVADEDEEAVDDTPQLVRRPDDGLFLIDGGRRRRIRSGLLGPVLEGLLGEAVAVDDDTFAAWPEGAPVEVLEGPSGPPFVVVGARRLPLGGLPLPHPVTAETVDALAQGPTLDLVEGNRARRSGEAADWTDALVQAVPAGSRARLVVGQDGIYLVEGSIRRLVTSGLLVPALEQLAGGRRPEVDHELDALVEGPPVAVLEAPTGPPFVVVGGKRLAVRGLPLPHPVVASSYDRLTDGPELDLVRSAGVRRANDAIGWLPDTAGRHTAGRELGSALVVDPDLSTWLVEGGQRRRVGSTLLAAALEQLLGPRRPVEADELDGWEPGPPVEVLEGRSGPPFVVVGGLRRPLRSLPVPYPVDETNATRLAEGPPLDVVRAVVARRHDRTLGWLQDAARSAAGPSPELVTAPDRTTWVLDGPARRQVRSGLLVAVLEDLLGPGRPMTDEERERPEGRVVEVLEGREGPPFLVVGGTRHALRSLPVPFPVSDVAASQLPEGPELDVALVTRRLHELTRQDQELRRQQAEREANPNPVGELKAYLGKMRSR